MFKESKEGQTHFYGDGCQEPHGRPRGKNCRYISRKEMKKSFEKNSAVQEMLDQKERSRRFREKVPENLPVRGPKLSYVVKDEFVLKKEKVSLKFLVPQIIIYGIILGLILIKLF